MLDRAFLATYQVMPSPFWARLVGGAFGLMERVTGTRVVFENLGALPAGPCLIATNSTQRYDFMPLRAELFRRGIRAVTVTKGKNYHSPPMRFLLSRLGVVPLASRGYLLLVDFMAVHRRRPTEEEYRALRRHLDEGAGLPNGEPWDALLGRPRELLGHAFDPAREAWREAVRRIYREVMAEMVRHSREAVAQGAHVQMYPEGTVSSRLGEGRIGAVQLAWTLGLPLLPCGMSGCREAFRGGGLTLRGGEVRVRFGEAYALPADLLPPDFRPFDPDHEARDGESLRGATGALMARLDGLLDERYRRDAGFSPDGTQGTRRFL